MQPFSTQGSGSWWSDEAPASRAPAHDDRTAGPARSRPVDPELRSTVHLLRRTLDLLPE
jgi:hypothetical protein